MNSISEVVKIIFTASKYFLFKIKALYVCKYILLCIVKIFWNYSQWNILYKYDWDLAFLHYNSKVWTITKELLWIINQPITKLSTLVGPDIRMHTLGHYLIPVYVYVFTLISTPPPLLSAITLINFHNLRTVTRQFIWSRPSFLASFYTYVYDDKQTQIQGLCSQKCYIESTDKIIPLCWLKAACSIQQINWNHAQLCFIILGLNIHYDISNNIITLFAKYYVFFLLLYKKCIKASYIHIVYIHIGFWRIKSFLDAFLKHSLTSIVSDGVVLQ